MFAWSSSRIACVLVMRRVVMRMMMRMLRRMRRMRRTRRMRRVRKMRRMRRTEGLRTFHQWTIYQVREELGQMSVFVYTKQTYDQGNSH